MPLHRVSHDDAAAKVAELERTETIVAIDSDDHGLYIATVPKTQRRAAGPKETR